MKDFKDMSKVAEMLGQKPSWNETPVTSDGSTVQGQTDRFVFLDERPWPFMVSNELGRYWLYYWADSYKNFATLRTLDDGEQERFRPLALPNDKAKFYLNYGKPLS